MHHTGHMISVLGEGLASQHASQVTGPGGSASRGKGSAFRRERGSASRGLRGSANRGLGQTP